MTIKSNSAYLTCFGQNNLVKPVNEQIINHICNSLLVALNNPLGIEKPLTRK
ncbi:protein of unknown function [Candidatus Nitrosocosmicus franklandus]|uniref:Uncharacterized protein n=1 Tax=Candidatus Nitrosocosmicus franklandianus TaxID=1798806 RepID=A0A484IAU4_9ARCH|nr:protein of unknown function [Candidatus Nitrosocosmicus franklandus]